MYIYLITNLKNNKKYVGQTNNFERRMNEHKSNNDMLIDKKIQEYGKDNFKYEIIFESDNLELINKKEREFIISYNSKVPNGYNVQDGGKNNSIGENNPNAILSEEEAQWILNNRNIQIKELYDKCSFKNKISYVEFKAIYNNTKWSHLSTTTQKVNNLSHSGEKSANANYTDDEVFKIRENYKKGMYYKDAWKESGEKVTLESFYNIYIGKGYNNIHMDVYTEANKEKHKPNHCGENNGRAKLKKEDVIKIRELAKEMPFSEIYKLYPQVSTVSIRNIINRITWKNV